MTAVTVLLAISIAAFECWAAKLSSPTDYLMGTAESDPVSSSILAPASIHSNSLETRQMLAKSIYSKLLDFGEDKSAKDRHLLNIEGSNSELMAFYDCVDDTAAFKAKVRIAAAVPATVKDAWCRLSAHKTRLLARLLVSNVIYYSDLTKDLLLCAQFKAKVVGPAPLLTADYTNVSSYPLCIFFVMLGSIVFTELLNFVAVFRDGLLAGLNLWTRLALACLSPVMPFIVSCLQSHVQLKQLEKHHEASDTSSGLTETQASDLAALSAAKWRLGSLMAKMRANENTVEHFVQLALLFAVLLAESSPTRAAQSIGNIVVDSDHTLVYAFVALSFLSLVRGHVHLVEAAKRGHLPLPAKWIVLPAYFSLSVSARLLAVVAFLTPTLGLFGTLKLAQMGRYAASNKTVYDIAADGRFVTLQEAWGEFRYADMSEMFASSGLPTQWLLPAISATIVVVHLTASAVIPKAFGLYCGNASVLHAFVCPPVFLDWDDKYRRGGETVKSCWRSSYRALAAFILLFASEHIALCAPLAILKHIAHQRSEAMKEADFPLLASEQASMEVIDRLLYGSLVAFSAVVPALQMGLALLYYKRFHAWSRVLSARKCKGNRYGSISSEATESTKL